MKNLLFAFIALFIFSGVSFGQKNQNNPYDYSGEIHNEVLSSFLDNNKNPNLSIPNINNQIRELVKNNTKFKKNQGERDLSSINFTDVDFTEGVKDLPNELKNFIDNRINDKAVASQFKTFISNLIKFKDKNHTHKDVYNYVTSFEIGIINNGALSSNQKEFILSVSSIARFSNYYWSNNSTNKGIWFWVADVVGGIAGGAIGATTGAGTIGGVITGAAIGSGAAETIGNK